MQHVCCFHISHAGVNQNATFNNGFAGNSTKPKLPALARETFTNKRLFGDFYSILTDFKIKI